MSASTPTPEAGQDDPVGDHYAQAIADAVVVIRMDAPERSNVWSRWRYRRRWRRAEYEAFCLHRGSEWHVLRRATTRAGGIW